MFIDYYENSKKDLQHYVRLLKSKGYDYGTHYLPHDGAHHSLQTGITNADMLEQLLRDAQMPNEVVNVEKTAILTGINAVRARFTRYHFDKDACAEGIKKLELYHGQFDKKKNTYTQNPVHDDNSHAADALRT